MPTETWRIGDVTITKVVESESWLPVPLLPDLLPNSSAAEVEALGWLMPTYVRDGQFSMGIYSFVVQTPDHTLVVDTACGNAKPRTGPMFNMLDTEFLETFRGTCDPSDVRAVVCTHLHADHVGWNTHLVEGEWIPTFANAAHYFVEQEYRYWETFEGGFALFDAAAVFADSVRPVADAGLVTFVEPADRLTPEVTLIPSHGHTPGHVSVLIESKGQSAVITGDLMHFPCQIGYPGWSSIYDADREAAAATRRAFLERFADTDTIVIGTHFATPTGVFVRRDGNAFRLSPAG